MKQIMTMHWNKQVLFEFRVSSGWILTTIMAGVRKHQQTLKKMLGFRPNIKEMSSENFEMPGGLEENWKVWWRCLETSTFGGKMEFHVVSSYKDILQHTKRQAA